MVKQSKRILAVLLAFIMTALLFTGCSSSSGETSSTAAPSETPASEAAPASEATPAKESYTFGFANATMNNGFFVTISSTFESLMEADGNSYVMVECDWDNGKQVSQVEDLVNRGVDFIFLAPADVDGARPGLEAAAAAKIPVIVLDNPVNEADSELVKSTVASDNYQAGVVCAEMLKADYPDGAKIAVLTHTSNNAALARVNGFKDTIATYGDSYEIVAELAGEGTIEDSIGPAEDIVQAHPEVTAWFACNELSGMGALTALEAAGKAGEVGLYSVDASPDGKELLVSGKFSGLAAQSPIGIATTAYDFAKKILAGEEVPEQLLTECFEVRKEQAEQTAGEWQ